VRTTSCKPEKEIPRDIIGQQNERIQNFIKSQHWTLVEKYTDRRKDEEEDTAFQQMRADGLARKFDMVVVDSMFRCGKNVSFAEDVLMKTFYPAGIHFAVVEDNLCSLNMTAEEVREYFKQRRNEYFGSQMTAWTRKKQAEGYLSVHDEKYGYLLSEDRKSFVVDEEVVPIIREIFYYLSETEFNLAEIADLLNDRGYEPPWNHLARVGKKIRAGAECQWTSSAVKRISENTAYIGYWKKQMDGKTAVLKTEPIIDKRQFDIVQKRFGRIPGVKNPSGQRSENAFVKQIFDKATGKALHCKVSLDRSEHQTFSYHHFCTERMEYDDVMIATVEALRSEQKQALRAASWMESEACQAEKAKIKSVLSDEAKVLFAEETKVEDEHIPLYCRREAGEIETSEYELQKADIFTRLQAVEEKFEALMEEVEAVELAFSKRNPWVQLYGKIEIPDELEKAQVRKWIDRVVVENLEKIEVVFPEKYVQWKKRLPAEWLEGTRAE
jgi:DNA invertase Pin-like site-specific DNA recombinase